MIPAMAGLVCGYRSLAVLAVSGALLAGCGGTGRSQLPRAQRRAIDRFLKQSAYISNGSPRIKQVALTFDDGPGPFTGRILDVLEQEHAPATFFEVGGMLADFHKLTSRAARAGFVIGDHSQTHPLLAKLRESAQATQLASTAMAIRSAGAPYPRLFRPPYGSFNHTTLALLKRMRMLTVLWSGDVRDYERPGTQQIITRALAAVQPGAIILMHDGGGDRSQTAAALPTIIKAIRARGYRLVTVPQMIHNDPPPTPQPLTPGTGPTAH